MRRKTEWKPKGQRRKPAVEKVEPYVPLKCKRCKKHDTFVIVNGVELCWTCDQKENPPAIGEPVLRQPPFGDYEALCARAERARALLKKEDESDDARG